MECMQTTFNIFEKPPVDVSIEDVDDVQILPLSGITNDSAVDFIIPAQSSQYTDLSRTYLHTIIKVTRSDAKDIEAGDVSLIPLWPQGIFRQLDMYLGQTLVSTSTNQAAFRAWLETFLSFSNAVKKDQLDVLEWMNGVAIPAGGSKFEAVTRLNLDMMQQPRYLLNGVSITLRLFRNQDDFILLQKAGSTLTYKISIEDIALYIRRVTPKSSILLQHAQTLAQKTAIYPIDRTIIKTAHITTGMQEETLSNIFMGQLPVRLVVGLVKSKNYNGHKETNPFTFEHFNISHISLSVNGRQIPTRALEPNFEQKECRRSYHQLLETVLGSCQDERSIGISFDDYVSGGKTLFGFTLVSDGGGNSSVAPRRSGNINLRLRFNKPLTDNVTVLMYAEFQNVIEIDATRNVTTDY
jgi:hypothetical protein